MASQLSLESVLSDIQALDQLGPAARANGLASLVKQVHEAHDTSSELRVLMQDTFCQALLKTIQPTASAAALLTGWLTHGPCTPHSSQSKPASRSQQQPASSSPTTAVITTDLAQALTAAASALELIYSWEDEQVVASVINFWSHISNLLCGSWLHQDHPKQPSSSHHTTLSPSRLLQANPSAPAGHAATEDPSDHLTDPSNPSRAATATDPQSSSTPELQYLTWLWSLGPAAVTAIVQQLHQFWHLTGINHLQHKHTQQQHNKGAAHYLINLLLLFLDLHSSLRHTSSSSSSSSSVSSCRAAVQLLQLLYGQSASRPASVAAAVTAGEAFAGVCCLLQAAAALHITLPAPATPTAARPDQEGSAAADTSTPSPPPPPPAAATAVTEPQPDDNPSAVTAWPLLAEAAGEWLRDCCGWCGFGEAANASPAAAAAAAEAARHSAAGFSSSSASTVARPSTVESLYDCFMMLLLQQMMQGPAALGSSSSSSGDRNSGGLGRTATGRQAGSQAAAAAAAPAPAPAGKSAQGGTTGRTAAVLNEDDWEEWLDSEACIALAALVATYDRPDVLARGLHMLTQQQLQAAENAAAADGAEADAATAGTQGLSSKSIQAAAKKSEKRAMGRALQLLERVFLWRQQRQALEATMPDSSYSSSDDSAAAGGVCKLLLGLSELLRPAANCSVEWRCAALTATLSAVEDFMQEHTGDSDLELQLWCDASVEGLLYCASHDPSIQARRAAVQLLQHVVLPNSSSTAKALIRCLAGKLSDKDSSVAAAALQLFVQLPSKVLCNSLTATQWCAAVQACLGMVCESGGSADTGTQGGRGARGSKTQERGAAAAARGQFAELLETVLLSEAGSEGQYQQQQQQQMYGWQWMMSQGGRIIGVEGCKQVLLMLMMEPGLEDSWQALAQGV